MSHTLPTRASRRRGAAALAAMLVLWCLSPGAQAAPEAHILRIDPRASLDDGQPILTTVVELVQNKRLGDVTGNCAYETGNAALDCMSDELAKPEALYKPLKFPDANAWLLVSVEGRDTPAKMVSRARWGDSKSQEGVGTAWLVMIDAAGSMGNRFDEAKQVASQFVNTMDPHDIVNLMFFNDRTVVRDSKWLSKKSEAQTFLDGVPRTFPTQGRTRQLLSILKQGATDGFKDLGNVGGSVTVPMHQAMVVLSNGASGTDVAGASPAAEMLKQYMTKGRFPEDNQSLPKAPVPIVSVWFPSVQTEELYQNARQFMENLANTEIGGFYGILREGQAAKAATIVTSVRRRFDQMHIIKWRVPCVAPTVGQSFRLEFKDTDPQIAGDASFANVPVGIDPSTWPLEIDFEQTLAEAKKEKLYPGGTVRIYGNFCWGADAKRAKLYMIPKNQPAPTTLKGKSVDEARKVQQQLIASKMVGKAISSDASYVEFEVPDNPKFLQSKGKDKYEARLVVVDTSSYRSSAITADKILTLPAMKKPLNLWLIGGLTFGGVVLLLLVIQIFRGGGGRRRGGAGAQRPMVPQPPAPGMPGGPGGYAPR